MLFSDAAASDSKPNPIALNYPEEIENGQVMSFKCRDGYNTQGPSNLRCHLGELAVNSLPECLPSPCLLPRIANAAYQGGYRAGLTIAHGSSVTIVCDNAANTAPVQMGLNYFFFWIFYPLTNLLFCFQIVNLDPYHLKP